MKFIQFKSEKDGSIVYELMKPVTSLYLWLALPPLLAAGYDHDIIYWLLMLTTVLLTAYVLQNKKSSTLNIISPDIFLGIMILWASASIFWSIHYVRSYIEILQLLAFGLVFWTIRLIGKEDLFRLGRVAFIAAGGVALFGILEYIFIAGGRIKSTFPNSNPLGIFLAMFFIMAWGLYLRKGQKKLYLLSVIFAVAFVLTGSRGSYIALVLSFPLLLLARNRKQILRDLLRTLGCAVISFILVLGVMQLAPLVQDNLLGENLFNSMTRTDTLMSGSVAGRLEFWRVSGELFQYNPLQGFGIGTYFMAYYLEYGGNEWYSRFAHNHYLQMLVETGIIGVAFFAVFIGSCLWSVKNRIIKRNFPDYFPPALAGSLAFLMHIFIDFSWNFPAVGILFFALLGVATGRNGEEKLSGPDEKPEDISIGHSQRKKYQIYFSYKTISVLLMFVFLATFWIYSSFEILKRGVEYEQAEEPEKALEVYRFSNRYFPINSQGYLFESRVNLKLYEESENEEHLSKAFHFAETAVELSPYDDALLNHLGKIYLEKNNDEMAEKYLKEAKDLSAYVLSRHMDLARFYHNNDEPQKAEEVLLNATKLTEFAIANAPEGKKPIVMIEAALLHNRLSRIYEEWGQHDLAEEHKKEEAEYLSDAFSLEEEQNDEES